MLMQIVLIGVLPQKVFSSFGSNFLYVALINLRGNIETLTMASSIFWAAAPMNWMAGKL